MPFDDAAVRDQALDDLRPAANIRRRPLLAARVNHPGWIVEVEGGMITKQLHMRLPVGVDGAHILPVTGKGIGIDAFAALHHCRDACATQLIPVRAPSIFTDPSLPP